MLIDPLNEAEKFFNDKMQKTNSLFFKTALGEKKGTIGINVEESAGRSSILDVTDINFEGNHLEKRIVPINKLDDLIGELDLGKIGLKIDTEGYEPTIRGAEKSLNNAVVITEVRIIMNPLKRCTNFMTLCKCSNDLYNNFNQTIYS